MGKGLKIYDFQIVTVDHASSRKVLADEPLPPRDSDSRQQFSASEVFGADDGYVPDAADLGEGTIWRRPAYIRRVS